MMGTGQLFASHCFRRGAVVVGACVALPAKRLPLSAAMGLAAVLALSAPNPKDPKSVHDHITNKLRGRSSAAQQQKQAGEGGEDGGEDGDEDGYNDFAFWRTTPREPEPQPQPKLPPPQHQQQQSLQEDTVREIHLSASSMMVHLHIPPLRTRIERFEAKWQSEHGGRLPTRDDELPLEAADLYALYFERHPEALPSWEARADAAREARAAEESLAEARAQARAKEWEEWEQTKKHTAFAEAKAEAWQQRTEVAGGGASALSGAASWVKEEETPKPQMTREAYVAKMRDKFGMDGGAAEFRAEQQRREAAEASDWARRGGHEADEAARREAWEEAEAKRQAGAAQPAAKEPATPAAPAAAVPAVAPAPPSEVAPAPRQGGDDDDDDAFSASMFWRRPR